MQKTLNHPIWHPFKKEDPENYNLLKIVKSKGIYLYDDKNNKYLDLISSWWTNIFGHCNKELCKTIYEQSKILDHVIFSDFYHEPAFELAHNLLKTANNQIKNENIKNENDYFKKVFFSDNGSTAVEVALKMATQFYINQNDNEREIFLSFKGSYHGDTYGSMSVGFSSGFFQPFEKFLFKTHSFEYPETWINDFEIENKETKIIGQIERYIELNHKKIVAFVIEPLIQGSSGMKVCRESFLNQVMRICKTYDILIIFDEVMTGFYRTGKFFAFNHLNYVPDIISLSKGLTAGMLPLGVTLCNEKIYRPFQSAATNKMFLHGHSYSGNPITSALANKTIQLLSDAKNNTTYEDVIFNINDMYKKILLPYLLTNRKIEKIRLIGSIIAFDTISRNHSEYGSSLSIFLKEKFVQNGLIIRPLGNTIYIMPPYCITKKQIQLSTKIIKKVLKEITI